VTDVRDPPAVRDARRWQYLLILLQEAKVDPKKVPQDQLMFDLLSPYERLGYTQHDIDGWIAVCDPEIKPAWDEVECFRAKARAALKPRPGLGLPVALAAGVAFLASFALTRRHH
jgi:hypothetical protein